MRQFPVMSQTKQSIWRLVQACAQDLTNVGATPFTRSDLIKCVRRKNPDYGENSINPIIQGVTNNLRGGAPGAVGKNILHSVGRGLFILSTDPIETQSFERANKNDKSQGSAVISTATKAVRFKIESVTIGSRDFAKVCNIQPQTVSSGKLAELLPQKRYNNNQGLLLNNYGAGPFCKFKIPNGLNESGVYAILENREVKYIGECQNLSSRYNTGYGNISPRNCFVGGQETNCRINNLIFESCSAGNRISLWFHQTSEYKKIESELRQTIELDWNRA